MVQRMKFIAVKELIFLFLFWAAAKKLCFPIWEDIQTCRQITHNKDIDDKSGRCNVVRKGFKAQIWQSFCWSCGCEGFVAQSRHSFCWSCLCGESFFQFWRSDPFFDNWNKMLKFFFFVLILGLDEMEVKCQEGTQLLKQLHVQEISVAELTVRSPPSSSWRWWSW